MRAQMLKTALVNREENSIGENITDGCTEYEKIRQTWLCKKVTIEIKTLIKIKAEELG